MGKIKVALAGIGNVAAFFVQAVSLSKQGKELENLIFDYEFGGYKPSDIKFVAAFDVSREKVGKDLADAIFAKPNLVPKFCELDKLGVVVSPGPVLDGVAEHMIESFDPIDERVEMEEVVDVLESSGAEILVNLLPVGSQKATEFYASAALKAGVAFINCIPVFIASDPSGRWPQAFKAASLPLLGDDIKGQIGATILHRTIVSLLFLRGVKVEETYQLNIGGNTDFLNMILESRLVSKRKSKTEAVASLLPYGHKLKKERKIRIGPSDYVPFLGNTKICYIYLKGSSFCGFPVTIDVKLSVDDKSMASAVLLEAVRIAKIALDRGIRGSLTSPAAFLFKHPPIQLEDDEARKALLEFVKEEEC